jgi:hypothetical protein
MRAIRAAGARFCACACVCVAVALAAGMAGCGASAQDQVQSKVDQFLTAIDTHNYHTLCTQVLAPSLLTHLARGGIQCEQAMRISLANVHDPILSVGRITVNGSRAQAITLSGAKGEKGAFESIDLVDTGSGWRISSLATPQVSRS